MYLSSDTYQFMMYHAGEWIVYGGSYDSKGQKIDKTYIKDIKYNDDNVLVKVYGDGSEVEVSTSEAVADKIADLDSKITELTTAIEIIKENN